MIQNIIFDLGNVLVDFSWRTYLRNFGFSAETEERIANSLFLSKHWQDADRGALEDEEIYQNTLKEIPDLEQELLAVWNGRTDIITEYAYARDWLETLKKSNYNIYILSNYARTTFLKLKEESSFLSFVDGMVISYEIKSVKPEPEIYKELIDRYSIRPEESLYLDDLPENIDAGKKMGFETILFTNYEDALYEMRKHGITI